MPYFYYGGKHNVHSLRTISGAVRCRPFGYQHYGMAIQDDGTTAPPTGAFLKPWAAIEPWPHA